MRYAVGETAIKYYCKCVLLHLNNVHCLYSTCKRDGRKCEQLFTLVNRDSSNFKVQTMTDMCSALYAKSKSTAPRSTTVQWKEIKALRGIGEVDDCQGRDNGRVAMHTVIRVAFVS